MIQQTPEAERFKEQMHDSLQHETMKSRAVTIPRPANVYTCGDQDEMVYFINLVTLDSELRLGQTLLQLAAPWARETRAAFAWS